MDLENSKSAKFWHYIVFPLNVDPRYMGLFFLTSVRRFVAGSTNRGRAYIYRIPKLSCISVLILLILPCLTSVAAQHPELETLQNQASGFELCQKAKKAGYLNYGDYLLNPKDFQVLQLQPIVQPYLTRLKQALDSQNTQLVTMVLPPRSLVFPELSPSTSAGYAQLVNSLEQAGLKTISVASVFERTKADFFFYYDHHWTPYAASEIAKEVATVLAIDDDAKQQFSSSPIEYNWSPYNSRLKTLSKLCNRDYVSNEGNYLFSWTTTMSASEGLFDNREEAFAKPSVLLGTSNSESSTLNFAGFLSEHTGQNISNHAFPSSGALGSMFYYFLSEEYQYTKPRYIFWEFLANPHTTDFNLNAIRYYRQIIPSIYGSCKDSAIATATLNLSDDVPRSYLPLFDEATSLASANSSDFYLSFDLSGDALDRIIVDVQYNTGHIDQSTIALLPPSKGRQKAYLEFLDNIANSAVSSGQVLSINLTFPQGSALENYTEVSVNLCQKD